MTYPFNLPNLPYAKDALEPHISAKTFSYHHEKHHQTYVDNLNKFVKDTDYENKELEDIIKSSFGKANEVGIFNNAAQVWNHTFYWHSMKPNGGGKPQGELMAQIEKDFGSYDAFFEEFHKAGVTQFGSGWAWLIWDSKEGKLKVTKTGNAELPMVHEGQHALLTADVWEHAYYLDYQNKRPDYLKVFLQHLVNWDFASENFAKKA